MNSKQNMLLYTGISCILAGIIFLLYLNGLLPKDYFYEYLNVSIGIMFLMVYAKTKNKVILIISLFFLLNASMMAMGRFLDIESVAARIILLPGILLLITYIYKRKSVILTIGSILTFWGIFIFLKDPIGIHGYYFSIGALMLFTVLAFIFIWIIERQSWTALPILIFGVMGTYLVVDALGETVRNIALQGGGIILILLGVIFVIKSLFNRHLEGQ